MFNSKLFTILFWTIACVAIAMGVDYFVTVIVAQNGKGYTPLITLAVATLVTVPVNLVIANIWFALREARDEAMRANGTKTQFLSNMSHELRTPLNAIMGFAHLLTMEEFAGKRVEYAELIHNSGTHLLSLVNDLLDLSRIEAGKVELHDEVIAFTDLAEECLSGVVPLIQSKALTVEVGAEDDLPYLYGDRRALKQILINLLTNAIKFSHRGGTVEIFARRDASGELAFGVTDHGVGIPAEDLSRVFERFGQARHDIARLQEGTGLGLPIVKGLAEAHGGRITLTSQVGQGTSATIHFPRSRLRVALKDVRKPKVALST